METNQLTPVTELSRRLVHTPAAISTDASAISTREDDRDRVFFIGQSSRLVPGSAVDAWGNLEKLKQLSNDLCIFLFMSSNYGNWSVDVLSQPVTAESQSVRDFIWSEITELPVHPRIEFGNRLMPHVVETVRIPADMRALIPGASLSQSFSIELTDEFD